MRGGTKWKTPYDIVLEKYNKKESGTGETVPDFLFEIYASEVLSVNLIDLWQMDFELVQIQLAWKEGEGLAEWWKNESKPKGEK